MMKLCCGVSNCDALFRSAGSEEAVLVLPDGDNHLFLYGHETSVSLYSLMWCAVSLDALDFTCSGFCIPLCVI